MSGGRLVDERDLEDRQVTVPSERRIQGRQRKVVHWIVEFDRVAQDLFRRRRFDLLAQSVDDFLEEWRVAVEKRTVEVAFPKVEKACSVEETDTLQREAALLDPRLATPISEDDKPRTQALNYAEHGRLVVRMAHHHQYPAVGRQEGFTRGTAFLNAHLGTEPSRRTRSTWPGRGLSAAAGRLDLLQTLILILDLHRHPIVEALELAAQRRYRLIGLLDLRAELLEALGDVAAEVVIRSWTTIRGGLGAGGFLMHRGAGRLGLRENLAVEISRRGGELFAEFHPRPADRLVEADHLGAEIRPERVEPGAILADLIGEKTDLAADLGELAEDLFLQFVDFSAEARDSLDHQLEPGAQLLEHRANSGQPFVSHPDSPSRRRR
jgi:hypothetical protein